MKSLFTLLTFFFSLAILAQDAYQLSYFNAEYVAFDDATSLNNGEVWDDPSYEIPIGFQFVLFEDTTEFLYLDDNFLGGVLHGGFQGPQANLIVAYGSDIIDVGYLDDVSESTISYKTTGTSPNRITKIEWDNCGFYNEVFEGASANRVDFQLWLYETSNNIEIRFGPNTIKAPQFVHDFGVPYCGLLDSLSFNSDDMAGFYFPAGPPAAPWLNFADSFNQMDTAMFLTGDPVNGQVYRFSNEVVNVVNLPLADLKIFPTITQDVVTIQSQLAVVYEVYSLTGDVVRQGSSTSEKTQISLLDLPAGMYILKAEAGGKPHSTRLIKQ
jgi:hypothetical protein